ncbi:Helix-turn-helix domain [Arthrobacter agilis]|nr:Helix-turn-helix domain [Arthrobacter agilis]
MLRRARTAKGLTQAELGADAYSTHFISLLERGQRQPTPDMVRHFSARLGMDVQTLNWWVEPPSADDQPALTEAMFAANYARDMQDDALAASEAEYAASLAFEQRNGPAWWDMSMLQAQSLIARRRLEEAEAVLLRMDSSSLMVASPGLKSVVLGRLSTIARSTGRLQEAIELAREAVAAAESLPKPSSARLQAGFILIAALSLSGALDDAWETATALDLQEDAPSVPSLLLARGAWAIGNVAFRRGDTDTGRAHHALASKLLLPQADLEAWAAFHRASALHQMHAGLSDDVVSQSLKKADRGFAIVGTDVQRLELTLAQAKFAVLTLELVVAGELLGLVGAQRDALDFESLTDLEVCMGQYYLALESPRQAAHHLAEAARLYSEAGADGQDRLPNPIRLDRYRGGPQHGRVAAVPVGVIEHHGGAGVHGCTRHRRVSSGRTGPRKPAGWPRAGRRSSRGHAPCTRRPARAGSSRRGGTC